MNDSVKSLGSRLLIIGSIGSSLLFPVLFTATPSLAGADDGVKCPSGYQTDFDQSHGILRCKRERHETRLALCPPLYPEYKIRKDKRDRCAPFGLDLPLVGEVNFSIEQKTVAVSCPQLPGEGFTVKIDGGPGSRDICERTIREFKYPDQR